MLIPNVEFKWVKRQRVLLSFLFGYTLNMVPWFSAPPLSGLAAKIMYIEFQFIHKAEGKKCDIAHGSFESE